MSKETNIRIVEIADKHLIVGLDSYEENNTVTVRAASFDTRAKRLFRGPSVLYVELEDGHLPDIETFVDQNRYLCFAGATPLDHIDVVCEDKTAVLGMDDYREMCEVAQMLLQMSFAFVECADMAEPGWVLLRDASNRIYATVRDSVVQYLGSADVQSLYKGIVEIANDADEHQRLRDYAELQDCVAFSIEEDGKFDSVDIDDPYVLKVYMDFVSSLLQKEGHTEASKYLDAWFEL